MRVTLNTWLTQNTDFYAKMMELNNDLEHGAPKSKIDQSIEELAHQLRNSNLSSDEKNKALKLLAKGHPDEKTELRRKVGILELEDIVCNKSQGRLDDVHGKDACAVICHQAIEHFLSGKKIKDKKEMYALLNDGIEAYKREGFTGKIFFEDVFIKFNAKENSSLEVLAPTHIDNVEEWYLQLMQEDPLQYPIQGSVKEGFTTVLNSLDTMAQTRNQKVIGVLTCKGETIIVHFPQHGKPQLFDSHGRPYKGMDLGASLRTFNSTEDLNKYLKALFKDADEPFNLIMVGAKDNKVDEAIDEFHTVIEDEIPVISPTPTAQALLQKVWDITSSYFLNNRNQQS